MDENRSTPLVGAQFLEPMHVLVTCFDPYMHSQENVTLAAAQKLNGLLLQPHSSSATYNSQRQGPIRVTALRIPMTYGSILDIVPKLFARPPLPVAPLRSGDRLPPARGYDFILHIGGGPPGKILLEMATCKVGYEQPDATGQLAPMVFGDYFYGDRRGFGTGYERFPDELQCQADVNHIIGCLRNLGIERVEKGTRTRRDMNGYLYYCSLAEAQRSLSLSPASRARNVLMVSCPPVDQPYSTDEIAEALKSIIKCVVTAMH